MIKQMINDIVLNPYSDIKLSDARYVIIFYFELMGAVTDYCREARVEKDPVTGSILVPQDNSFEPCQGPQSNQDLLNVLNEFNSQGVSHLQTSEKWMKHKDKQLYYLGHWKDHSRVGQGIEVVPGKYAYYGAFEKEKTGKGKLVNLEQNITYEGEMLRGGIHGQGKITHHQGQFEFQGKILSGKPVQGTLTVYHPQTRLKKFVLTLYEYPESKAFIDYEDGRHYQGSVNMKTFLPEGLGMMTYPDEKSYEGNWLAGKYHGNGIFKWQDGSEYHGEYEYGHKQGKGRLIYASKRIYDGYWSNGKQEGEGTLFDPEGKVIHRGYWREGKFEGEN